MTRRRAALLGGSLAILVAGIYLLLRRRRAAPALPAPAPLPLPQPAASVRPAEPVVPVTEVAEPERVADTVTIETPPPVAAATKSPPRSWAGRAVPARTPPSPAVDAALADEPVEQPLPTWVRLGIVVAALVAFFAVSLIATKQV
ncbi:MAG: hypothetical protein QOE99_1606 [Actinomycetota bacterium]|nr:hypothetical protein [Actinomycetota bacterium]